MRLVSKTGWSDSYRHRPGCTKPNTKKITWTWHHKTTCLGISWQALQHYMIHKGFTPCCLDTAHMAYRSKTKMLRFGFPWFSYPTPTAMDLGEIWKMEKTNEKQYALIHVFFTNHIPCCTPTSVRPISLPLLKRRPNVSASVPSLGVGSLEEIAHETVKVITTCCFIPRLKRLKRSFNKWTTSGRTNDRLWKNKRIYIYIEPKARMKLSNVFLRNLMCWNLFENGGEITHDNTWH